MQALTIVSSVTCPNNTGILLLIASLYAFSRSTSATDVSLPLLHSTLSHYLIPFTLSTFAFNIIHWHFIYLSYSSEVYSLHIVLADDHYASTPQMSIHKK